jgi:DNA (cytosine-5)-methyltransferase 1
MTVLSIDLFSGIGGMQLALKGYTKTVLYCDIDKYCSAVLSERISDGLLDPAPIHSDIKNLHLSPHFPNVQMICGGFPCVDLSSIGLQNGIKEGTHSGLFLQVV